METSLGIEATFELCNYARLQKLRHSEDQWARYNMTENSGGSIIHESHILTLFYYSCWHSTSIYPSLLIQSQLTAYPNSVSAHVSGTSYSKWWSICLNHVAAYTLWWYYVDFCGFVYLRKINIFCIFEEDNYIVFIHNENIATSMIRVHIIISIITIFFSFS